MQSSNTTFSKKFSTKTPTKIILSSDWQIQSSEKTELSGSEISSSPMGTKNWYSANVPGTVLNTLVINGVYKDPYYGENLKNIDKAPFEKSWWFRTEFKLTEDQSDKNIILSFDGINYKAKIWLNGRAVKDTSDIFEGPFRRFQFDISDNVVAGINILALEVFPPLRGQFSIGFVDWNPAPPDKNMGIFRPVILHLFDKVYIEKPFIESKIDRETYKHAMLHLSAELINYSNINIKGILKASITDLHFEQKVELMPGERKKVIFKPDEYPDLKITNPRLWWPNNLGDPDLYELGLEFITGNVITDKISQTFGIRSVEDYVNDEGQRGFRINGKNILIKGAGWTDDMFLGDTPQSLDAQIRYVRHMNLNCIRLEGLWGKDHTLYDLCDRYGILIMAGWSCHWEHELHLGKPVHPRFGGITEPEEIELIAQSWEDQIIWLRNHPSIFVWSVGSDMVPHPDLERRYFETFRKYDTTRPYLNSTGGVGSDQGIITKTEVISDFSGSSGVKMLGPYDYTPPVYWYTNKHLGGAYGFNTETCPGANIPPLESVKKMIPAAHLWPVDEIWDYHCALYEFSTLDRCREAIKKRYGSSDNVEDFVRKAQLLNYELMRPMFEAFQANKGPATGIIQWMLNSAWPAMYWQLYDHYLMPNAAFYGVKKACEPLHLLYNYGTNAICVINDTFIPRSDIKAKIQVFNIDSQSIYHKEIPLEIPAESTTSLLTLPAIDELSTTYFLDLRLINGEGTEISNNFYWLSVKADILDYDFKFDDFAFYTPSKEFADFTLLNSMPKVKLNINHHIKENSGMQYACVTIENPTKFIAFFIEMNIKGRENGNSILPQYWEDNYISLLPGERRTINGSVNQEDLKGDLPELKISGWNV
jgi:exo-1,4-beta-D-glucosaminidase